MVSFLTKGLILAMFHLYSLFGVALMSDCKCFPKKTRRQLQKQLKCKGINGNYGQSAIEKLFSEIDQRIDELSGKYEFNTLRKVFKVDPSRKEQKEYPVFSRRMTKALKIENVKKNKKIKNKIASDLSAYYIKLTSMEVMESVELKRSFNETFDKKIRQLKEKFRNVMCLTGKPDVCAMCRDVWKLTKMAEYHGQSLYLLKTLKSYFKKLKQSKIFAGRNV